MSKDTVIDATNPGEGKNNIALASITENVDYSTPQGKLFLQMLGGFAEYFSDSLATHVSKGTEPESHLR